MNSSITLTTPFSIDFGINKDGADWYVVNDDVMGGLSSSKLELKKNSMKFTGVVSLENNGGFASVRSSRKNMDLSSFEKVTIRFRSSSKNRIFALRLNTNNVYYRPSYNQNFQSVSEGWQELTFDLLDFNETILGRTTGKKVPKEKLDDILRIGIMLNDKQEGSFDLEVDSIIFS